MELKEYTTIESPIKTEIIIKKSRFICRLYPVSSIEEVQEVLSKIKKEHWNATHNCSAVIVGVNKEYTHCSDDGEPQGTAGIPMLEALKMSGLTNVLAVVTRYFGGIMLGAGGLARAYSKSIYNTVQAANKIKLQPCVLYETEVPFKNWGKMEAFLACAGYTVKDIEYTNCVKVMIYTKKEAEQKLIAQIADITGGNVTPIRIKEEYVKFLL